MSGLEEWIDQLLKSKKLNQEIMRAGKAKRITLILVPRAFERANRLPSQNGASSAPGTPLSG